MRTFTFYSYKGGTGRSLVVANVARYLSRFGQKVVVLDFDLEAPGLHYKLSTNPDGSPLSVEKGVVDYFHVCALQGERPENLCDYLVEVPASTDETGSIALMAAGEVPSGSYWRKLSQISWREFLYAPGAVGVAFFLDLKERIEQELNPDFILIDARTGITEIGGVATTVLPDKVVALLLSNRENLEGARVVLRSLRRAQRPPGAPPVDVVPVLSRIPYPRPAEEEEKIVAAATAFLNQPAEKLEDTLEVSDLVVLHSEPELQVKESLLIGGNRSPDESLLLRDYLRLFNRLIPPDVVSPHIGKMIDRFKLAAYEDPDGAQREFELLTGYGHPDIYRELLKFYRLRNIRGDAVLRVAERLWDVTRDARAPVLWQAVKQNFGPPRGSVQPAVSLEFVENVWIEAGADDEPVGMALADCYDLANQRGRATMVLGRLVETEAAGVGSVVRLVRQLTRLRQYRQAKSVIEQHAGALAGDDGFVKAWAQFALASGSKVDLQALSQPPFREVLAYGAPGLAYRILLKGDRATEAEGVLVQWLRGVGEGDGLGAYSMLEDIAQTVGTADMRRFLAQHGTELPRSTLRALAEIIDRPR